MEDYEKAQDIARIEAISDDGRRITIIVMGYIREVGNGEVFGMQALRTESGRMCVALDENTFQTFEMDEHGQQRENTFRRLGPDEPIDSPL